MDEKSGFICTECQQEKDDGKLVRKCFDCGCEYCNHSVPQLGMDVTPMCPNCNSTNVAF